LEAGINISLKNTTAFLKKILSGFVKKIYKFLGLLSSVFGMLKRFSLFSKIDDTKESFIKVKRRTVAFYQRPASDISHLSILVVILITLSTGASASFGTEDQVAISQFEPIATAEQYASNNEKLIFEADAVATLASIYSDELGQDAAKVADALNMKADVVAGGTKYLSVMPIVETTSSIETARSKVTTYVVLDGDTLWSIAKQFNVTTDTIRYANKLEDENSVSPGQTLTILPATGLMYTVASGDTLAGIATSYKASEALIVAQNDLYGEELVVGAQIFIPDGEIPEAPKAVVATTTQSSSSSNESYGSSDSIASTGIFRFPTLIGSSGYYNGYHNWAIDIPNNIGTPIFAADGGRIVEARYGWNGGYGNTILIDHGNGYQTRYGHMSSLAIVGGYVSSGQVIGYMGSTGRSTGSHLHLEIILNGVRQNPIYYF
jgi:murein DD-endopeptidase MepM/ murein hydrolase activator NlpD